MVHFYLMYVNHTKKPEFIIQNSNLHEDTGCSFYFFFIINKLQVKKIVKVVKVETKLNKSIYFSSLP